VTEVRGQTLGIVGYGDIGERIAERARGFGLHVLALSRRHAEGRQDPLVDEFLPRERLLDLVSRSDYIAVTLPLTPETRGLIAAREIAAMKPAAVLVNVGRGAVVDERALIQALETRRIRGAALDVFETEPLPAGHPFYRLENVLLSPHCADHTATWRDDAVRLFLDNLERFQRGQPLRNVVEKSRGY
jgi:phosphoglycerate dehydrogenase-like enzyme